jgi:hypothetical protein
MKTRLYQLPDVNVAVMVNDDCNKLAQIYVMKTKQTWNFQQKLLKQFCNNFPRKITMRHLRITLISNALLRGRGRRSPAARLSTRICVVKH